MKNHIGSILNFVQGITWLGIFFLVHKEMSYAYILASLFAVILAGLVVRIHSLPAKGYLRESVEIAIASASFGVTLVVAFHPGLISQTSFTFSLYLLCWTGACLDIGHLMAIPPLLLAKALTIWANGMVGMSGNKVPQLRLRRAGTSE